MFDRVNVNLPYSVTIGERTLQPGDYTIQQLRDNGGGSRVLLIYSDSGMKFETSAMTIPALDQNTPDSTKVVLHHFGNDYYFDKVWIQGKDYGYEFPLPDAVKSRERERAQPISVAANYSTVQQTESSTTTSAATAQSTASSTTSESSAAQSAATAPSTATAQASTPQPATAEPATTQPSTPQPATVEPATTPSTTQATTQPTTMAPAATASTSEGSADRAMPDTAAGWLMMLFSGSALSGAGMMLRRKR
jgi:hypothetical protein